VFIALGPVGKMVRQFLPSGSRFFVRQRLDQTIGLHDAVDSCLHGRLLKERYRQRRDGTVVPMGRFVENGAWTMDPTRCPHCGKRMKPVVTDDGRTGLSCLTCDAVQPRQTDTARWTENPAVHAKVA
jgi:hypothetical protein